MPARRAEGTALLVAGHGAPGAASLEASAVHTLGQIGEALLSTGAAWQIRRLTASTGDRYAADRRTIKRSLIDLASQQARIAMIVLLGQIIDVGGELALVTDEEAREYPEDATLPLAWIRERLGLCEAEQLVLAVSATGDCDPARWLEVLGTQRTQHLIAIDSPAQGNPMVDALLVGLCGDALDPRTGTVTMASLSEHLERHARCVQPSALVETIAQPPPLAGLWDVRRSQLANRPRRAPGEREDLTGTVLPGRFRLDKLVARGTFGTVYRARQLAVERDVAIKVLHGDIDPASEDGRLFVHEIRSVGRIDHTNVVRIYQADITHDGRLFFAMDLLDGRDLQALGAEGTLPRERAVDLVRQLLAGLGAAHDAGLVHADIKPANAIVLPRDDGERVVLVDFGLARLRPPDRPAESAGGTPAYMAPEQLDEGRVDARSDLFSAALVLVWLMTGWRRPNALALVPPLDQLLERPEDADLRAVLARALALDPAKRYQSARELSAALAGTAPPPSAEEPAPFLPFRHLASLTEADRDRLHGRAADLALVTEHVLYRRSVIYTAPSGTGKTSILRAGLLPRLEALGIHAVYHRARADSLATLAAAIDPAAGSFVDAVTSFHRHRGGKLVIVVDQLEAALVEPAFVRELLAFDRFPAGSDVSVLLSVREDYLARLLAQTQELEPNLPIVRLPPLDPAGARTAIVAPLAEARLAIEPELLDTLLADLQRAAAALGPEMGWGSEPAVFPPHLQLACSVLYESLAKDDRSITLAHYRRLGGFDAIVGEHLDRVMETELEEGHDLVARDLFLALVTSSQERKIEPESELLAIAGAKHGAAAVTTVLEVLRSRGLLVRVRGESEASWELVHDSLVPRVLAWIDRKDLARRRAIELLRHHLRRSSPDAPSLLSRKELRELAAHPGAVDELDAEWKKRDDASGWIPSRLVAHARSSHRRRFVALASVLALTLGVGGASLYQWRVAAAREAAEDSLRARDLGRFVLSLEPYDWDPVALAPRPARPLPGTLTWRLHAPDLADRDQPGAELDPDWVRRGQPRIEGDALVEQVEAHGGPAFLVVERAGCTPSIVPIAALPGYATRHVALPTLRVAVPTCQATLVDTVEIPAGPFIHGGVGEPVSTVVAGQVAPSRERELSLPAFRIDRTEVTNAAFAQLSTMANLTGIEHPGYPTSESLPGIREPRVPVTGIDWFEARAYCRYLGKELPSSAQWTKALRGGLTLADGSPNPLPRRNLPWGHPREPMPAYVRFEGTPQKAGAAGSHPEDVSVYGVLDLAGSVSEFTSTSPERGIRITRGGNWIETEVAMVVDFDALENPRSERQRQFSLGARCVYTAPTSSSSARASSTGNTTPLGSPSG